MKNFLHICIRSSTYMLKSSRRRILALLCFSSIIYILFKWGFMCSNIQPRLHIKNVCKTYMKGESVGNLCHELCEPNGVSSLSCHNFYMEKEAVFSGLWMNSSVVFKSLKKVSHGNNLQSRLGSFKDKVFPSEKEFYNMIKTIIKYKFNIVVNSIDAKRMSYIQYSQAPGAHRHTEMKNVWSLLQDNEYLALLLYEKFEIFPKIMGTCGSLYAVQKLNSISGFQHLMTLYDSQEEWEKRIRLSLMILDFLHRIENDLPEPLHICDVKMNHFGVTDDFKSVMFLDLDSVHPKSIVNTITGDGTNCKQHSDCDLIDCRSFCNLITFKCQHGVVNNNLQIVCEKIFLGWVMSGRVVVPGLLLGPRAPGVLVEVLETCANPNNEAGVPRAQATIEIRKQLYNLLVHLLM